VRRASLAVAGALSLAVCASPARESGARPALAPVVRSHLLVSAAWLADRLQDSNVVVLHVASDPVER
jgi:hypothetical protein